MPFYLSRTWRCIPVLLSSALLVSACETTPREGDTAGPEISIFEAGYTPAIFSSNPSIRQSPRRCRDVGNQRPRPSFADTDYHVLPERPSPPYSLSVFVADPSGVARIEARIRGARYNAEALGPAGAVVEVRNLTDEGRSVPYTYVTVDFASEEPRTARDLRFSLGSLADLADRFRQEPAQLTVEARDFSGNRAEASILIGAAINICR